jgi:hypothetical protein
MKPTQPSDKRIQRMEPKTWLLCKVGPGQFTGEYVVTAQDFNNSTLSLFVPDEYVEFDREPNEGQLEPGWVQVEILDSNESLALVQLPRQPLENGRTVTVPLGKLETRPAKEFA